MSAPHRRIGRKLLVASLGVASVSYVACGTSDTGTVTDKGDAAQDGSSVNDVAVGNLMPNPDATFVDHAEPVDALVANLVAPPDDATPPDDAPADQLVANLIPPPADAGDGGSEN